MQSGSVAGWGADEGMGAGAAGTIDTAVVVVVAGVSQGIIGVEIPVVQTERAGTAVEDCSLVKVASKFEISSSDNGLTLGV